MTVQLGVVLISFKNISHFLSPDEGIIQLTRLTTCYTGPDIVTSSQNQLLRCAALCVTDRKCIGVNFRVTQGQCDLVQDDTIDQSAGSFSQVAGCSFYRVDMSQDVPSTV